MGCCASAEESSSISKHPFKPHVIGKWRTTRLLGKGGFGSVFEVIEATEPADKSSKSGKSTSKTTRSTTKASHEKSSKNKAHGKRYALKLEVMREKKRSVEDPSEGGRLPQEVIVLNELRNKGCTEHIPQIFDQGTLLPKSQYIVMTLLGPSLTRLAKVLPLQHFSPQTVAIMTKQTLAPLNSLHKIGYLHRDIKPGNFVVGSGPNKHVIYLIDYGLTRKFVDENFKQLPPRKRPPLRGTLNYMSYVAVMGEQSPRDDLWSLFYMWVHMRTGTLPWLHCRGLKEANKVKKDINANVWLRDVEPQYLAFFDCLTSMHYESVPSYTYFEEICNDLMNHLKVTPEMPFDWEPKGHYFHLYLKDTLKTIFNE